MKNTFTKKFSISSFDLNPRGEARLTTMANFLQEMAYHHASHLGFGYDDMNEKQTMWVLSRMRIRINKYPVWDDQVSVETWHKGMDRLFGLRDFRIMNQSGEVLGAASSAWLILDSHTRRPIRPSDDVLQNGRNEESAFAEKLEKIKLPDTMKELTRRTVQFSDLDIVGHVNNVKYMEWCIDAALAHGNVDREIRELEINFMHEALLGNEITISGTALQGTDPSGTSSGNLSGNSYFVARRDEDGQEIIRARLAWD